MGVKLLLPLLAFVAYCQGAALPSEVESLDIDSLLDMFTANIANLESYAENLGLSRNKRDTHAGYKTFGPLYGVKVGLKYNDPANKLAGGEAFIHIDDLQKIVKTAHSNEVEVNMKFDGGASTTDGLFKAEINYQLTHSDGEGVEEGTLVVSRELVGGKWATEVKTTTKPFSGKPIIPAMISNADFGISSDKKTFLTAHYVNPSKGRDLEVTIKRIPGQEINIIVSKNKAEILNQKLIVIEGSLAAKTLKIKVEGPIDGQIVVQSTKFLIDLDFMGTKVLQVNVKKDKKATKNMYLIKVNSNNQNIVALAGVAGFALPIELKAMKGPGEFKIKEKSTGYGFSINFGAAGLNFKVEQKSVVMWEYNSKVIKNVNTLTERSFEAKSSVTINPSSKLYQILLNNYPLGAFTTRENYISIYVDRVNKNKFLPKFKIVGDIKKNGVAVFNILADTTGTPYEFELTAPNLRGLLPYDRKAEGIKVTVNHDIGKSLNIKSNAFGGLELQVSRQRNAKGLWDIRAFAKKAGVEMMTYDLSTSLVNDAAQFKFGLNGEFIISPESVIYKNLISNYKILTPFNKRVGEIEIFFDKVNKNTYFNKWKVAAKTDKDGANVLDVHADFTNSPYEIKVFAPAIRNVLQLASLTKGNKGAVITIDHQPGQYLELVANLKKFSGLKITTNGNAKELTFNGAKVGSGEFKFSANKIEIGAKKINDGKLVKYLKDGDSLKAVITWKGNNPLKNALDIDVKGNKRQLDFALEWDFSNLDFDIATASEASFSLKAVGKNPLLGSYKITRDASLKSAGKVIAVSWTGNASFQKGSLAALSPIHTDLSLELDAAARDLTGKVSKNLNGKEYSITFPKGTGLTSLPIFSFTG